MGKGLMPICIVLVLFLFSFNTKLSSSSSNSSNNNHIKFVEVGDQVEAAAAVGCSGKKVEECLISLESAEEEEEDEERSVEMEMEMDSESNRRLLWAAASGNKRYISYEALRGDSVPCNRPGIPYYNCHALPKANPYTRGCSVITGCARGD